MDSNFTKYAPVRGRPVITAKVLAVQLAKAGHRPCGIELLAASEGMRPHVARLAAGHCADDKAGNQKILGLVIPLLRTWADAEENWMADAIADAIILEACAEFGITARAFDLAVMAVISTDAIARPMSGGLFTGRGANLRAAS
jgi:hypothetical protein